MDELREKFFDFLLKKTYTEKQAQEFLNKLKIPDDKKDFLMREAQDMGLIDDEAYANLFAEGHESWGNAKISYELSQRGIQKENINIALENIPEEFERVKEIYDSLKNTYDDKKIQSRLLNRGFSLRAINKILKNKNDIDY